MAGLEKRHAQLKSTQLVAPMFLRDPARIEGLLCCHFIAMLIQSLIERHVRAAMADRDLTQLSLYPKDRGCAVPTAARVLEIFAGLSRHHLHDRRGCLIKTFQPSSPTCGRASRVRPSIPRCSRSTTRSS